MKADRPGRVILLTGASSSGKSSIGRALQHVLADPWFFFPIDSLGAMRSTAHTRVLDDDEVDAMLRRTRMGYHRAVAALTCVGNDVIMDYPLSEPWRLADDITVDTTTTSPEDCARTIVTQLSALASPTAFDRLREVRL